MTAILKHELRSYFHSLTAYVFGAFLLAFIGFGAMLYNIQASVSNFEFVLGFTGIVFVVLIPILTMRVISEEKKQKTDQLLYSLPVTTTQIVGGKYLALLTIFAIPVAVVGLYPLLFARYGEVSLMTAYGSLFAFFLTGAALIALGMFISSLTESQGMAAGIGIAVILLNYYSVSLAEQVSSTAFSALVVLCILIFALYFVLEHLLQSSKLAFGISTVLMALTMIGYFLYQESFEGLIPHVISGLSVFARLDTFISGVFDLTGVVYFLSFAGLFLFLTVQSLEKKRYN